jgi:hypothetical protein
VTEPIQVPTIGEPELPPEIVTERALEEIIQGSRVIHARHQGFTKAMARKLLDAEAERDALKQKFEDEEMAWKHAEEVNGKLEAELATARQTIQRLSAPVSDEECNVVMFRVDSGHTFGAILDALIAARKDANDKEKA